MSASISRKQARFFPENQFEPLKQKENFHYDQRLMGQQPSFSPDYLIQPYHQTSFYSIGAYPRTYYNTNETIYPYEKEAQFIKYPGFDGLGAPRFGARRALNYGRPSNLVYPGWLNSNVANFDDVRRLPLKMRAVFVPSGPLSVQQSSRGPLVRNSLNQI